MGHKKSIGMDLPVWRVKGKRDSMQSEVIPTSKYQNQIL